MRIIAIAVLLAGAFGLRFPGAAVADDPAPVPAPTPDPAPVTAGPALLTLDKAVASGLVEVRGTSPMSYQQVDLVLTSKSDQTIRLDLAGRHLKPTTSGCQRLGLSHPLTPGGRPPDAATGTWPIELAPHQMRTVRMRTCCMDSGRPCPRDTDRFLLASAPTPPAVEAALRWWTDHPSASQGFVNAAVWANDVRLLDKRYEVVAADGTATPLGPVGRKIRSYGGIIYTLVDGALTSVDREGVRRFHGTQIYDVLPRGDALYGIAEGLTTGYDVLRFAPTGEPPWGRVFGITALNQLADLVPVVGGAYLTRTGEDTLLWRASRDAAPTQVIVSSKGTRFSVGVVDAAKGRYVAVLYQSGTAKSGSEGVGPGTQTASAAKFFVYDVDARDGTREVRKMFWNARDMVAGPGGVYALSPVGTPEKLDGEKLRRLPAVDDFASIVLVGSAHLILKSKDGSLVAYDVKTGRTSALPASAPEAGISIDPVTDDIVWVGEHDFLRWRFGAAEAEVLP